MQSSAQLSKIKVLVVEDEPLIAMGLADQMRDAGAIVVGPCATAQQAIDVLQANDLDVAIIDFVLADENSEGLQAALETKGIPFVVLTGYPRILVRRNDRQRVLSKPVSPKVLFSALKDLTRT
jgi:DNA-binding response OmpR family regulator